MQKIEAINLVSSRENRLMEVNYEPSLKFGDQEGFNQSFSFSNEHYRSNFEGLTLVIPSGDNRYISSARLVSWYPNPTSFARRSELENYNITVKLPSSVDPTNSYFSCPACKVQHTVFANRWKKDAPGERPRGGQV
ncbi:Serine/Threonine-Protein Kinase Mark2 [Manis pentadactyla]|nr:Serine/Threonine-Protein Kinase Mark2 [Manis pentadactyla]